MTSSSTMGSHASHEENFQAYDRIDGVMHVLCSSAFKLIFLNPPSHLSMGYEKVFHPRMLRLCSCSAPSVAERIGLALPCTTAIDVSSRHPLMHLP